MNKRKLLCLIKAFAFCALLLGCVALTTRLVERKASVNRFGPFLSDAKAYDVLFVGDSHVVNGVFPMDLWQDYGIASYNLASYGNTLPVTYWTTMIALTYAAPKLVVIGVKDVDLDLKLTGSSGDVHTALDCYPPSPTKLRAIADLMSDPQAIDDEGRRYADLKWEYIFTLGKYHSRWSELGDSDFHPIPNRQKGGEMTVGVAVPRDYDIVDYAAEAYGTGYDYLRRAIEACRARGIEVLLVHLPYPATQEDQMAACAVGGIAQEYDVNYVDFVALDQVVDYRTDCYDAFSHLNPSGARKTTDYLGRFIADHYDIPDRRGDAQYAGWADDFDAYIGEKTRLLCAQTDVRSALMLLHDDDYSVCIAVRQGSALYADEELMRLMHNIAREHIYEEDAYAKWSDGLFPLGGLDDAAQTGDAYLLVLDRRTGETLECTGDDAQAQASFGTVSMAASPFSLTLRGADGRTVGPSDGESPDIRIFAVDNRTGEVAASLAFSL